MSACTANSASFFQLQTRAASSSGTAAAGSSTAAFSALAA